MLSPFLKDILQAVAWLVAAIGGVVAAFKGVAELAKSTSERAETRLTRERELRWRQAEVAKKVIDELMANPLARAALKMLDWSGLTYARPDANSTKPITQAMVASALRTNEATFADLDEPFIRDCFDALLDGFERIEHYLRIGLILWDDVKSPFAYHRDRLMRLGAPVAAFVDVYEFHLAKAFLGRFDVARTA